MFIVVGVMNPDIPFGFFEGFVENSMATAMGLMIALILHYVAHNRYLASKWQQYEQQQGAYNTDSQINHEGDHQRDFSHLRDQYEEERVDSEEDPIELKNGNRI